MLRRTLIKLPLFLIGRQSMKCPLCQTELPNNAKFCMSCGNTLQTSLVCDKCRHANPLTAKFCVQCSQGIYVSAMRTFDFRTERFSTISAEFSAFTVLGLAIGTLHRKHLPPVGIKCTSKDRGKSRRKTNNGRCGTIVQYVQPCSNRHLHKCLIIGSMSGIIGLCL